MNPIKRWSWIPVGVLTSCAWAADAEPAGGKTVQEGYPKVELASPLLKIMIYLPDAQRGYYRGSRFDWSGVVARAEYAGHQFYRPWHAKHNPFGHDAIEGTAEEFSMDSPPGFDEVAAGGVFYKIGIGALEKKETTVKDANGQMVPQAYSFAGEHKVVQAAPWKVAHDKDRIEFAQDFQPQRGWGWKYVKKIVLAKDAPAFTIERTLTNAGTKTIDTTHYCHNFTLIDDTPVGPDYRIRLPFSPPADQKFKGTLAAIKDSSIVFTGEFTGGATVWAELAGLTGTAKDNAATIENAKTGASLVIEGDRPLAMYRFWATRLAACPEPFIAVKLAPGEAMTWKNTYTFKTK